MNGLECSAKMMRQIVYLSVAIMTARDAVVRAGCGDLVKLNPAIGPPRLRVSGLQEAPAPAATVVVRFIRRHFDYILLTDYRLDNKPQIIRHLIAITLADNLAGILNGKFYAQVFVPVCIDL